MLGHKLKHKQLQNYISLLLNVENTVNQRANLYNEYKTKYIPALENNNFESVAIITAIKDSIQLLIEATSKKMLVASLSHVN